MQTNIIRLKVLLLLPALMPAAACTQVTGTSAEEGSIRIAIGSPSDSDGMVTASSLSSGGLEASEYVFYGEGPDGAHFSVVTENELVSVENLVAGEWLVVGEARNDEGTVVLEGETSVEVEPQGEAPLKLVLEPLSGIAELVANVSWNDRHTIDPSVSVTLASSEETSTYSLAVNNGTASLNVGDIEAGVYRITVQLYDGGEQVAGSAGTFRAVYDMSTELEMELDALNKVGLPIDIDLEEFAIGWDPPDDYDPDAYRVYARERGVYSWTEIAAIDAEQSPSFTVSGENLDPGIWELAVSAVADGSESELHTSMSDSADPESGWYVRWDPGRTPAREMNAKRECRCF